MRLPFIANMVAFLAIVSMLSSCSKSSELAGLVPADSDAIVKINPRSIFDNAGCTIENGKIKIPAELMSAIPDKEIRMGLNVACNYTEGLNLDEVFVFVFNNDLFVLAKMDDPEIVERNITDIFDKPEAFDGYKCFDTDNGLFALKDNILWLAESKKAFEKYLKANVSNFITENSSVTDYLSADNTFAAVIPTNIRMGFPSEFSGKYIVANFNLDGKKGSYELGVMDKDGKRMDFSSKFADINPDFLAFMPSDANFVAAIGGIADDTLKNGIEVLANQVGMAPIFKGLDGPIALGVSISPNITYEELMSINPNNISSIFKMSATAHYTGSQAESNVNYFKSMLAGGANMVSTAEGFKVSEDGIDIYIGADKGYLVASNFPTTSQGFKDLSGKVKGYPIVAYTAIAPCKLTRSIGMNYGAESLTWLDSDGLKGEFKLTDTDLNVLQAYLQMLTNPTFQKFLNFYLDSFLSYDDYYDYDWDDMDEVVDEVSFEDYDI